MKRRILRIKGGLTEQNCQLNVCPEIEEIHLNTNTLGACK